MPFEDPALRPQQPRRQPYRTAAGVVVPSVTEVIGLLDKPALVTWAWRLGMQGVDAIAHRDQRAAEGTVLHEHVRAHLTASEPDLAPYSPAAKAAGLVAFIRWRKEWFDRHTVRPVLTETRLVSERYGFGGTPDLIADVDGTLAVLDWKTSKRVYREHILQVAAYALMAHEHGHPVACARVVHVSTEADGGIGEVVETDLRPFARAFLALLRLHHVMNELPPVREDEAVDVMSRFDDPEEDAA